MTVGMLGSQEVVKLEREASIAEAIKLMRDKHVGAIVVMDIDKPVGILTDRDIVIRILCNEVDPDILAVGDAMSYDLVTISIDTPVLEALSIMRIRGIRRAPVIDNKGNLVSIISIDDIINHLAEELNELALLIRNERKREMDFYFGEKTK